MKKLGNKIIRILKIDADAYNIKLKFSDGFLGNVSLLTKIIP